MAFLDVMGNLKWSVAVPLDDEEDQVAINRLARKKGTSVGALMLDAIKKVYSAELREIHEERFRDDDE